MLQCLFLSPALACADVQCGRLGGSWITFYQGCNAQQCILAPAGAITKSAMWKDTLPVACVLGDWDRRYRMVSIAKESTPTR